MPRFAILSIISLLLLPLASMGQGIRMSPDFLPLEVGNVWRYRVSGSDGAALGEFEMRINERTIIEGASFYVFDRFPLAPDGNLSEPVGIRFDSARRQFVHYNGESVGDLFPSLGASAEVVETDDAGLPVLARFDYGDMSLTLERGVGIVEARYAADGRVAELNGARVGDEVRGDVAPRAAAPAVPVAPASEPVATISQENPSLQVEAIPSAEGHRFVLRVRNTGDQLLAFDFGSSQSFDFVVLDPAGAGEVWRWSRRMFFSEVTRSEGLRGGREWTFEADWNHRNDDLEPVPPGSYQVYAVLTASTPLESESVPFEVR